MGFLHKNAPGRAAGSLRFRQAAAPLPPEKRSAPPGDGRFREPAIAGQGVCLLKKGGGGDPGAQSSPEAGAVSSR